MLFEEYGIQSAKGIDSAFEDMLGGTIGKHGSQKWQANKENLRD